VLITHLHWDQLERTSSISCGGVLDPGRGGQILDGPPPASPCTEVAGCGFPLGIRHPDYAGNVRTITGTREVLPGLRLHWVGGHTPGLQAVSIETSGGRLVLASDAIPCTSA